MLLQTQIVLSLPPSSLPPLTPTSFSFDSAAAKRMINEVPRPSSLLTSMLPPAFSTIDLTTERPSPVPWLLPFVV